MEEGKGDTLLPKYLWDEYILSAKTFLNLSQPGEAVAILNFHDEKDNLDDFSRIRVPLLVIMGKKDDAATIPVEEIMSRVKSASKNSPDTRTIIMGDANHGYDGYEQKLAESVNQWILHLK